jgi:hypothetical protein
MTNLFAQVDQAITQIKHGWTSVNKGQILASMIVALRPAMTIEIGVYAGKGLVSMALAHAAIGHGMAYGIDPYNAKDSLEGQTNPEDRKFWDECDYQGMMKLCLSTLNKFECSQYAHLIVQRSDRAPLPREKCGVLRIDGNHGEMAIRDVMRWSPVVQRGGFLFIDDLEWTGKAPTRAAQWIESQSGQWQRLYGLDDGLVYQRI